MWARGHDVTGSAINVIAWGGAPGMTLPLLQQSGVLLARPTDKGECRYCLESQAVT